MPSDLVDVPALRAFLVAHAVRGLDAVDTLDGGGTRHRRLVAVGGSHVGVAVTLPPTGLGAPVIEVEAPGGAGSQAVLATRRWLGLDADPAPAVEALADDPVLGPLVTARPHLRVPGSPDPFETAVLVVLGQHVSLAAGRRFAARLVAAHGAGDEDEDEDAALRPFPSPEVLAAADPDDLRRAVGLTGARARTVVAMARAVAGGGLVLDPAGKHAQARSALLALPGVGPWTADLVALRALRDPDVFLPGDLVLRRALGGVTARAATTASEAWRPHRSLAVLHLWTHHAIDPPR